MAEPEPSPALSADDLPPPRNQPKRWGRARTSKSKPYSKDKSSKTTIPQSISAQRNAGSLVNTSSERARALRSFEPIFLNTDYIQTLAHLVCEQIQTTDPRLDLQVNDLLYVSRLLVFYQIARCDQLHGYIYRDLADIAMFLENLEMPNAIADYVESIGPFRMMNGVNALPSVANFVHPDWIHGVVFDDQTYALWHSISPQYLVEDQDLDADVSTCWRILPSILRRYRMCAVRLSKKTPCRKISNVLAGRANVICSTAGPPYAREIYSPEECVVADVRKSSITNFHIREDLDIVPVENRRLLRPWFYAGRTDVSAVILDSLA